MDSEIIREGIRTVKSDVNGDDEKETEEPGDDEGVHIETGKGYDTRSGKRKMERIPYDEWKMKELDRLRSRYRTESMMEKRLNKIQSMLHKHSNRIKRLNAERKRLHEIGRERERVSHLK